MSNQQQTDVATPTFDEFSPASYEEWRAAAEKALKGASFEKRLITKTYEGIDLQPLYRQENIDGLPHLGNLPGFAPYTRGTSPLGYVGSGWDVAQELHHATPAEFNTALRADLECGQNAINIALDHATLAGTDADQANTEALGQGGLSISSLSDLEQALDGIDLESIPIYIQASTSTLALTALLAALVKKQGKSTARLSGCVGMDPLGQLVRHGQLLRDLDSIYDTMTQLARWANTNAPKLQTITVQGHPYHNGGANTTQELAFVLATAVEYLRAMQARGLSVDEAAPRIRFSLSIGSNFFMEIARLRAARPLWAKIVQAFGGNTEAQKMKLHARTSSWNKTVYDPHVNMLRVTTEAFSSVVGGCDSLHISPFDELIRVPDDFSRRIARNTHAILREETQITNTVDPAGGSWYIENLTDSVARKSWEIFQEIEKQGGMAKALEAGVPQLQVADMAARRAANLAHRKDIFVGTNMYPNLKEQRLESPAVDTQVLQKARSEDLKKHRTTTDAAQVKMALDTLARNSTPVEAAIQAVLAGATLGDITHAVRAHAQPSITVNAIYAQRGAQSFEKLREAAADYVARTGSNPQIFLANIGPLVQHKARADFATAFLGVGGFETINSEGVDTPEAAAEAALASGTQAVAICSTDATYPDIVPPLVQKLKQAKPDIIVMITGFPKDHAEAFKTAGVDDFIHVAANCQALLSTLQKKMGVSQ